jgi:hypothetical protein
MNAMTQKLLSLINEAASQVNHKDDVDEAKYLVYASALIVAVLVLYLGLADVHAGI